MIGQWQSKANARSRAAERFRQMYGRSRRRYLWRKALRRPTGLVSLNDLLRDRRIVGHRTLGIQAVSISRICGSEGRAVDFDPYFQPLRAHHSERWIGIAIARMTETPLPPVELLQVGEWYFVRDGHHRISVARYEGQAEIDAQVTLWQLSEATALPSPPPAAYKIAFHRMGQWVLGACIALLNQHPLPEWPAVRSPAHRS